MVVVVVVTVVIVVVDPKYLHLMFGKFQVSNSLDIAVVKLNLIQLGLRLDIVVTLNPPHQHQLLSNF